MYKLKCIKRSYGEIYEDFIIRVEEQINETLATFVDIKFANESLVVLIFKEWIGIDI